MYSQGKRKKKKVHKTEIATLRVVYIEYWKENRESHIMLMVDMSYPLC